MLSCQLWPSVADNCHSTWKLGSLWITVDRCGSLWIAVAQGLLRLLALQDVGWGCWPLEAKG